MGSKKVTVFADPLPLSDPLPLPLIAVVVAEFERPSLERLYPDVCSLRPDVFRIPRSCFTCSIEGTRVSLSPELALSSTVEADFATPNPTRFCSCNVEDEEEEEENADVDEEGPMEPEEAKDEDPEGMNGRPVVNEAALLIRSVALLSFSCWFCCCCCCCWRSASVEDESEEEEIAEARVDDDRGVSRDATVASERCDDDAAKSFFFFSGESNENDGTDGNTIVWAEALEAAALSSILTLFNGDEKEEEEEEEKAVICGTSPPTTLLLLLLLLLVVVAEVISAGNSRLTDLNGEEWARVYMFFSGVLAALLLNENSLGDVARSSIVGCGFLNTPLSPLLVFAIEEATPPLPLLPLTPTPTPALFMLKVPLTFMRSISVPDDAIDADPPLPVPREYEFSWA